MKRMVPIESVVVVREGKRVTPVIGKPFDFTDSEVESLRTTRPEAIRKPINEGEAGDDMLDLPEDGSAEGDAEIEEANAEASTKAKAAKVRKRVAKAAGVKVDDL